MWCRSCPNVHSSPLVNALMGPIPRAVAFGPRRSSHLLRVCLKIDLLIIKLVQSPAGAKLRVPVTKAVLLLQSRCVIHTCACTQAKPCRLHSNPFWQSGSGVHFTSQTMALDVDKPETNLAMLLDREDFQERLIWGRQRGLALIFAAEAGSSDERSSSALLGLHTFQD